MLFLCCVPSASVGAECASVVHLRRALEEEFGLKAEDKTDRHSPRVLHNLLLLLREGFPSGSMRSLSSLRSFYAYAGHDTRYDLAAYHEKEKAISIGGAAVWSGKEATDFLILSTLAHEIGHAWVFGKLSAPELARLGEEEGGWIKLPGSEGLKAEAFLAGHPNPAAAGLSITSKLASRNVHEWFADAFAAAAMHRLGEKGLLGENWKKKLRGKIGRHSWVDYGRLQPGLRAKLEAQLAPKIVDRSPATHR